MVIKRLMGLRMGVNLLELTGRPSLYHHLRAIAIMSSAGAAHLVFPLRGGFTLVSEEMI